MKRRAWTEVDLADLRQRYPSEHTSIVAAALGRSLSSVYGRAHLECVYKTPEFIAEHCRGLDPAVGKQYRFKKGHIPANKGVKGWDSGGRSHETRFKKGHKNNTEIPLGGFRLTTKERHWCEKVCMTCLPQFRFRPLHILIWERTHGPIPPGHVVRFIDGNAGAVPEDVVIKNLECISMAENMLRNTIHNLPKPVVDAIQQRGRLTREINKQRRAHEEQHR